MKLIELFESDFVSEHKDDEHFDALKQTGFFGTAGAGCLIVARDTGRFLLSHRSQHVEQPNSWGNWGGAIDSGEDPREAAKREVHEEAGYSGKMDLYPMFVFTKGTFRYSNFLAVVDSEFKPKIDWESQGYKWVE